MVTIRPKIEPAFYNRIREAVPIVSVDIMAVYSGDVLLVKRKNIPAKGLWWFPGGGIRKWESPQMTVKRELSEETGLAVSQMKFVMVMDSPFPRDNLHCVALVFTADVSTDRVILDEESSNYKWLNLEDSKGRLELHPYVQKEVAVFYRRH